MSISLVSKLFLRGLDFCGVSPGSRLARENKSFRLSRVTLGVAGVKRDDTEPVPSSDNCAKGLVGGDFPLGESDERASKARRRAAGVSEGVAEEVDGPNSEFGP